MPTIQHQIARPSPADTDTLDLIAATAAQFTDLLDELCTQEPAGDFGRLSSRRITLDQAAAAAADLHTLAAALLPTASDQPAR